MRRPRPVLFRELPPPGGSRVAQGLPRRRAGVVTASCRPSGSPIERVDDPHAGAFELIPVSGDDREVVGQGCGGDEAVLDGHGSPGAAQIGEQLRPAQPGFWLPGQAGDAPHPGLEPALQRPPATRMRLRAASGRRPRSARAGARTQSQDTRPSAPADPHHWLAPLAPIAAAATRPSLPYGRRDSQGDSCGRQAAVPERPRRARTHCLVMKRVEPG